jgi:hypothetical protein
MVVDVQLFWKAAQPMVGAAEFQCLMSGILQSPKPLHETDFRGNGPVCEE